MSAFVCLVGGPLYKMVGPLQRSATCKDSAGKEFSLLSCQLPELAELKVKDKDNKESILPRKTMVWPSLRSLTVQITENMMLRMPRGVLVLINDKLMITTDHPPTEEQNTKYEVWIDLIDEEFIPQVVRGKKSYWASRILVFNNFGFFEKSHFLDQLEKKNRAFLSEYGCPVYPLEMPANLK